jgi:hypothetical protein
MNTAKIKLITPEEPLELYTVCEHLGSPPVFGRVGITDFHFY